MDDFRGILLFLVLNGLYIYYIYIMYIKFKKLLSCYRLSLNVTFIQFLKANSMGIILFVIMTSIVSFVFIFLC
jgi:hypothetical protein